MLLLALEGNTEANIIDIACGTGLTGAALSEKGFKNIDGIEGSQGMLKMALEKNIHNHIFQMQLGEEDISQKISAGSYDAAVSVGAITANSITMISCVTSRVSCVTEGMLCTPCMTHTWIRPILWIMRSHFTSWRYTLSI